MHIHKRHTRGRYVPKHLKHRGRRINNRIFRRVRKVLMASFAFIISFIALSAVGSIRRSPSKNYVTSETTGTTTNVTIVHVDVRNPAVEPDTSVVDIKNVTAVPEGDVEVNEQLEVVEQVSASYVYSSVYTSAPVEEEERIEDSIGNDVISIGGHNLVRYDLPDVYYSIDYSTFQPYMNYTTIKDRTSQAYKVVYSENTYVDNIGLLRYKTTSDQFTIDGNDDYVIALGTYYKEKGTCGSRYLIVTSSGYYTAITGDEKDNSHTDPHNMFSYHGEYAGLIEWLVDTNSLDRTIKQMGTVTAGPLQVVKGKILYIYKID